MHYVLRVVHNTDHNKYISAEEGTGNWADLLGIGIGSIIKGGI
jgi:hypothetical protein